MTSIVSSKALPDTGELLAIKGTPVVLVTQSSIVIYSIRNKHKDTTFSSNLVTRLTP